jgi:hypothetical protein
MTAATIAAAVASAGDHGPTPAGQIRFQLEFAILMLGCGPGRDPPAAPPGPPSSAARCRPGPRHIGSFRRHPEPKNRRPRPTAGGPDETRRSIGRGA